MSRLVIIQSADLPAEPPWFDLLVELGEEFQFCVLVDDHDPEIALRVTDVWLEDASAEPLAASPKMDAMIVDALTGSWPHWIDHAYRDTLRAVSECRAEDRRGVGQ